MIYSPRLRNLVPVAVITAVAAVAWLAPRFAGAAAPVSAASPDGIWQRLDQLPQAPLNATVEIKVSNFKAFTVNRAQLAANLAQAPMEFTAAAKQSDPTEITLPKPDGSFAKFRIEEVALMESELAAKYPDIKTYRGRGIDDPAAVLHLDVNARTVHAQVLSPSGAWYIDPYWHHDGTVHMSYRKSDLLAGDREFKCLVNHDHQPKDTTTRSAAATGTGAVAKSAIAGTNLRTYRLACATSLTYSQYHGGLDPDLGKVLAALVTMNNRVSGVYETELGIRMILINAQELIISTRSNPGPYTDSQGDISTNPPYLDERIRPENYDIGHVVTTGSGGIAGLGVVCRGFSPFDAGSAKASGTTGVSPPVGDAFFIDYVAHEMGHQFGGNHTFDGTGTNCSAFQNEETAYEPGSGTTIQAYAGICGNNNLQAHSDPYFHFASLEEMFGYASGTSARVPLVLQQKGASGGDDPPEQEEANPSSGTLNPTGPDLTWKGTAVGGASESEETCVEGVNCDTFTLTLAGEVSDWEDKAARILFNWEGVADDYDVYVRKGGVLIDSSTGSGTTRPEIITIIPAARDVGTGEFKVRVVYFTVAPPAQQYTAVASVISRSNPPEIPTCAVLTPTGNNPPTVDAGPDYKIPARTPFALTALNANDPNGDPITFTWEEADLDPGFKDANQPDDGTKPIIRSRPPSLNPRRTFVQWPDLLANQTQNRGERLPTTTRELNFRVTARDNVFGGWAMDSTLLNVIDGGKGFAVTSPNTAVTYEGGSAQTVTWDVANTTGPEINTTHVNILVSTDAAVGPNGEDPVFTMLLANTPNDGSEVVALPNVGTSKARIMVQAVGNVFFDISDVDFSITGPAVNPTGSQLLNISTRSRVQTGDNVMIGGFIVTGDAPKKVVLRAIGPSLSSSGTLLNGRLEDPTLELLDGGGNQIAFNDNWADNAEQRQEVERHNLQPGDDRESAIAVTLAPGLYTAIVRGVNDSTGIGLVEAYDVDRSATSKLANISTRGFVETGDNVLIGGFIVGEQSSGVRVVARAIGPSLKAQLPQALDDPTLQLVDQHGNTIRANDNWKDSTDRGAIETVNLAPTADAESALVATLSPAPYTAIVRGRGDTSGIGLVEIYHVPNP